MTDGNRIEQEQRELCRQMNVEFWPSSADSKVGISSDTSSTQLPLNGLRHRSEGDTCGWYLWSGEELSQEDDFFQPLHVRHLIDRCPEVLPFLGLPPGYRFLKAS